MSKITFKESWLYGIVDNKDLKQPVEKARDLFGDWNEKDIKVLWRKLKKILDQCKMKEKLTNSEVFKDLNDYHVIFSWVIVQHRSGDAYDIFLKQHSARLEQLPQSGSYALRKFLENNLSKDPILNKLLPKYSVPEPLYLLVHKRLLALILFYVASKDDVILARDIYWQIVYMRDPRETYRIAKAAVGRNSAKAAQSKNMPWRLRVIKLAEEGKNNKFNTIDEAANEIFPLIQQQVKALNSTAVLKQSEKKLLCSSGFLLVKRWIEKAGIF